MRGESYFFLLMSTPRKPNVVCFEFVLSDVTSLVLSDHLRPIKWHSAASQETPGSPRNPHAQPRPMRASARSAVCSRRAGRGWSGRCLIALPPSCRSRMTLDNGLHMRLPACSSRHRPQMHYCLGEGEGKALLALASKAISIQYRRIYPVSEITYLQGALSPR